MDASQILVIILAAALAIFLILSVILVILFIKIALQIQRVTETAEQAASKFDNIVSLMQKAVAPAMVAKFAGELMQKFLDKKKSEKEEEQ